MRTTGSKWLGMIAALPFSAVHALAVVDFNASVDWFNDATFAQVPGQAVAQVASLGNTFAVPQPGSTPSGTNCAMLPEPSFSCTGTGGSVRQVYDLTATAEPHSGVVASGVAKAGNDAVSMSLSAHSDGAMLGGTDALLYNLVGIDRQRVRFNVGADAFPEFIPIDVTFTVQAAIEDASNVDGATYLAQASANLHILEAATLTAPPFGTGTMLAPFVASAFVSNGGMLDAAALSGVTETMDIRPNAEYWVALEAQVALSLVPSPGFPARDYAGLDIDLLAYADPVFALNPEFAASHPDIAAAFSIERIAVVPLPPALPLLAGAMVVLLSGAQRRRDADGRVGNEPGSA